MNSNLLLLLDQSNFAPVEVKCDIISTLISEGCFKRETKTATFFGGLIVSLVRLLSGVENTKKIYKEYFLKNPQIAENDFALLISTILMREHLPLIQDFLYALFLSGWQFKEEDMKIYLENIMRHTGYDTRLPTEE
jgi:hypothetical protein